MSSRAGKQSFLYFSGSTIKSIVLMEFGKSTHNLSIPGETSANKAMATSINSPVITYSPIVSDWKTKNWEPENQSV